MNSPRSAVLRHHPQETKFLIQVHGETQLHVGWHRIMTDYKAYFVGKISKGEGRRERWCEGECGYDRKGERVMAGVGVGKKEGNGETKRFACWEQHDDERSKGGVAIKIHRRHPWGLLYAGESGIWADSENIGRSLPTQLVCKKCQWTQVLLSGSMKIQV